MPTALGSRARDLSRPYYEDALPAHDVFHAKRVRDVALQIADRHADSVDRAVLATAAWLHDIGRPLERVGEIDDHGSWAASEAATLLQHEDASPDQITAVEHCLRAHSIRQSSPKPETLEAKLLFDADKVDAAGAVGLVRLACIVGERSGRSGEPYAVIDDATTLKRAGPDRPDIDLVRKWMRERLDALYTGPGRRLGESRWNFVEGFFDQFARDVHVTTDL